MNKLKSHKTVEQIAKKHRMEVSFIQKQLDMGEPIEHEHTQDHDLAKDIALQHLDEFPDYYTRLKKMEADAKKHHKKFKDVKEGNLHRWYQDSESKDQTPGWVEVISGEPCAREEGEEGTPKCVSSNKRASMTKKERISAQRRKSAADPKQPEKSGAAKPTYVSTDLKKEGEKMQEQSFTIDTAGHKSAQKKQKIRNLASRTTNPNEKSAAERKLSGPSLPLADEYVIEGEDVKGKGSGKKDTCYHKVKSRYNVWPSAYASGALVKCRKVGATNWGTKSEETMHEEERFCPLCDKRETRSECSYGEKAWDKVSVKDEEYSMVRSELKTVMNAAKRLNAKVQNGEGSLEAWVQSKITKAADYLDTAADYVTSGEMEESIGFTIDSKKHKKRRTREKIRNIAVKESTEGEKSAASGKLGSTTELPNIKKEETLVDKITNEILDEKCWSGYKKKGMKTMFGKKYPNCVKEEDATIEDAEGNTFAEVIDLIKPEPIKGFKSQVEEATRLQAETGNIIAVMLSWRGKVYSIKMFFPQVGLPNRKEISAEIQKVYPNAQVLQYKVSTLQPGMPLIQVINSKSKNYLLNNGNIGEEAIEETAAWTRKEGKNKKGGLNEKGRKSYEAENPGSNLRAPQPEGGPRKNAFCARMSGMKKKLTSAKTANDPDSRINKSLRAWNC